MSFADPEFAEAVRASDRAHGTGAFGDYFARMMPDAEAWFAEHAAEPVVARSGVVPEGEPLNPTADGFLVPDIVKAASYIEVPDELLMDCGLIPDTRPPLPPTPWRWRLRNRVTDWRERTARRAYKVIAGYWPDDGEDNW